MTMTMEVASFFEPFSYFKRRRAWGACLASGYRVAASWGYSFAANMGLRPIRRAKHHRQPSHHTAQPAQRQTPARLDVPTRGQGEFE